MIAAARKTLILLVFCAVAFLCFACGGEPVTKKPIDAAAIDVIVEYDGEAHGIIVTGTAEGDKEYYSADGESWAEAPITYIEIGEYTIYVKICRDGCDDYVSSATLKIMPAAEDSAAAKPIPVDISGVYLCADGVIEINGSTIKRGDDEKSITPILDGSWIVQGGETFSVRDGFLTISGKTYRLIATDEKVFEISAGSVTRYAAAKDKIKIDLLFDDGVTVKAGGGTLFSVDDVNYCESVSGVSLARDLISSDLSFETGEKKTVIEFSKREINEISPVSVTALYDGSDHAATVDGAVYVAGTAASTPPSCVEVGVYEYTAVVLSDGYLPTAVSCRVEILPDYSGIYFTSNGILVIDGLSAELNGEEAAYAPDITGGGKIDGATFARTQSGIDIGGVEYKKTDKKLLGIKFGNKIDVVERGERTEEASIFVTAGEVLLVSGSDMADVLWTGAVSGDADVVLNGRELLYLYPDNENDPAYMFTENDITAHDVAWLEIKTR